MSYLEYEFLDWPSASGQFQTGLNVQLPGSEYLLPVQNGYLDPTATLFQETKHQSHADDFLDATEDDDWICFGTGPSSGDFGENNLVFSSYDDLLPSSPEIASFDLNAFSQDQIQPTPDREIFAENASKSEGAFDGVVVSGSHLKTNRHPTQISPEDISLDSGRLCDFDPAWLFLQVPVLPSLEEVESVLSASPLLDISDEDALSPTGIDNHSNETTFAPTHLNFADTQTENVQLSASPLNLLLTSKIGQDSLGIANCSAAQVPQSWVGDGAPGHSLGLYNGFLDFDNASMMSSSTSSLLSLDSNHGSSPSDAEETTFSASFQPMRSSPASVRVEPYPTSGVKPERRERKREQNKTAALKYRQKKRAEQGVFVSECDVLEKRNSDLKSRVEELTREISYLKGLIAEIYSSQAE